MQRHSRKQSLTAIRTLEQTFKSHFSHTHTLVNGTSRERFYWASNHREISQCKQRQKTPNRGERSSPIEKGSWLLLARDVGWWYFGMFPVSFLSRFLPRFNRMEVVGDGRSYSSVRHLSLSNASDEGLRLYFVMGKGS